VKKFNDPRAILKDRQEKSKRIRELKLRVIRKIFSKIDFKLLNFEKDNTTEYQKNRAELEKVIFSVTNSLGMPEEAGRRLQKDILEHILTFGVISDFILDPTIRRIMINQRDGIFLEEQERQTMVDREFSSNASLGRVIQRMARLGGTRISLENPIADFSIEDGIWVTAVLPPIAAPGPILTIQKSGSTEYSLDDHVERQSMSRSISFLLTSCIEGKRNIIVSGLTGSGKTTLLNTLIDLIPIEERIVVIEDRGELILAHPNSCFLRPRYNVKDGANDLNSKTMLQTALRMSPNRIILGDCRGEETLELLQAMSSGHKGCLTTCHASSPADLISRLETLILLSRETISQKALKNLIVTSIDLIVHLERMSDNSRKITYITELTGMEGDVLTRSDLYRFRSLGLDQHGNIDGIFEPTGIVPSFFQEFKQMGITIPRDIF